MKDLHFKQQKFNKLKNKVLSIGYLVTKGPDTTLALFFNHGKQKALQWKMFSEPSIQVHKVYFYVLDDGHDVEKSFKIIKKERV
jgi:hypothetical protein